MIGRIVRSVDFERVLAAPTTARSPHFAIHHVDGGPSAPARAAVHVVSTDLSTGQASSALATVDDRLRQGLAGRLWLGAVIPKRHAKRAVTRSLLKRQIRAAVAGQPHLPPGLWVVRLRAPFDRARFPSASSECLRQAAHDELEALLADARRRGTRT